MTIKLYGTCVRFERVVKRIRSGIMRVIKGFVKTNMTGSRVTFEFEVDDDATDDDIAGMVRDCVFDNIDWGYTVDFV